MQPFIHSYAPKSTKEIVGQEEAIQQLAAFLDSFKKQKKKACLIYGSSGIGKTSAVYCLAKERNLDVIEVNASEFRNKENIDKVVGGAMGQQSLFSRGKVILIDEVDGISGTKDRGGLPEIVSLIKTAHFPVILTASNPWDNKYSSLRSASNLIEFKQVSHPEIASLLKNVAAKEKIIIDDAILSTIARSSGGDVRAALNDLQIISATTRLITKSDLDTLGFREHEESILQALVKVLKSTDPQVAIKAFDNITEDVDEQMLWIDKNMPEEYTSGKDRARAYDYLSKADIFQRRIKRWQHWRFLVYINAFLTAGVAVSKDKKYESYTQYKPTGRLLKIYWANIKAAKKKAIAEKLAAHTHTSTKKARKSVDYFKVIFEKDRAQSGKIAEALNLDEEEIEYMKK